MLPQLQMGQGSVGALTAEGVFWGATQQPPDALVGAAFLDTFSLLMDQDSTAVAPHPQMVAARKDAPAPEIAPEPEIVTEIAPVDVISAGMAIAAPPVLPKPPILDKDEVCLKTPPPPNFADNFPVLQSGQLQQVEVSAIPLGVRNTAQSPSLILPNRHWSELPPHADSTATKLLTPLENKRHENTSPDLATGKPVIPPMPLSARSNLASKVAGTDDTRADMPAELAIAPRADARDVVGKIDKIIPMIVSPLVPAQGLAQSVFLEKIGTNAGGPPAQAQTELPISERSAGQAISTQGSIAPISATPLNTATQEIRPQSRPILTDKGVAKNADNLTFSHPQLGSSLETAPAQLSAHIVEGEIAGIDEISPNPQLSIECAEPSADISLTRSFVAVPVQKPAEPPSLAPHTAPATVTEQLMPLVRAAQNGPVEVLLNPAELGHLRFEIIQKGDQVQVILTAERSETLEMLRRNGEQLIQEMRGAGFAGASISYGQWGQGAASGGKPAVNFASDFDGDVVEIQHLTPIRPDSAFAASRALNLRL